MDVFRSATLAIAIILLIFMGMLMYYEFKVNVSDVKYPPYTRDCPDYSYNYNLPGVGDVCMFDTNNFDYKRFLTVWKNRPSGNTLCPSLYCNTDYSNPTKYERCTWSNSDSNVDINKMYFLKSKNKRDNINNIRNCKLTLDGIV